ncbi:SynChlorMet cassette protein ScmC [Desulfurobacterium crinifex]
MSNLIILCKEPKEWANEFLHLLGHSKEQYKFSKIDFSLQEKFHANSDWSERKFKTLKAWINKKNKDIVFQVQGIEDIYKRTSIFLAALILYEKLISEGALLVHSALIKKSDQGFLLAGRSGIGKSTACRRIPHPWQALSDDLTLVVPFKGYKAYPVANMGEYLLYGRISKLQKPVSLKAVFFLEQSKEDRVLPIMNGKSALLLYTRTLEAFKVIIDSIPKEEKRNLYQEIFNNVCQLSLRIPAFKLFISLEGKFWKEIDKVITL